MELRAPGATMPEAFAGIAVALFAAMVDLDAIVESEVREVRAHGADLPALLHRWLDECLYVHDVEGFACRSIEFAVFEAVPSAGGEALRLHAFLRGEPLDASRHPGRARVRGISHSGLLVAGHNGAFRVEARLDL
ncbi:MAG TPA: archease [Candidatus Bathyarchaeia archaeon]|nr:archease [Candidatus Bathyarchaeia archaeon]